MRTCRFLSFLTTLQEIDHIGILCGVTEVVTDRRFQYLCYQVTHITKTRNYFGRFRSGYMTDLCHVEVESKTILTAYGNRRQIFIKLMSFCTSTGPVQYQVSGGY